MSLPIPHQSTWTCCVAGVQGTTHTHLLPSPPNFTANLHTPTGLSPAPCLSYPLLSLIILPFSKEREAMGIFPKPETEPTWAEGTDQKWHPKGCPLSVSGEAPSRRGTRGRLWGEEAAFSWAGAGSDRKGLLHPLPVLRFSFHTSCPTPLGPHQGSSQFTNNLCPTQPRA